MVQTYLEKSVKVGGIQEYNFEFFCKLVPHSCLASELFDKFISLPHKAINSDGELVPPFTKPKKSDLEALQPSCMVC